MIDPQILSLIGDLVGLGSLIIAVMIMRNGSGQAAKRFADQLELGLQRFEDKLDQRLDARFSGYVSGDMLDMRIRLIESQATQLSDQLRGMLQQHDHRITRDAQQIAMIMECMLRAGLHVTSKS